MRTAWIGALVVLLGGGATASADVVGPGARVRPAPTDCPPGAQAIPGGHGTSPHCRPSECDGPEDCMGSMAPCEELGLCVAQEMVRGALYPVAPRACETDTDCEGLTSHGDEPPRCEVRPRCGGLPGPGHDRGDLEVDVTAEPEEPAEPTPEPEAPEEPPEPVVTPIEREPGGCGCRVPAPGAPTPRGLLAGLLVAVRAGRSSRAAPRRRPGARSRRSAPR